MTPYTWIVFDADGTLFDFEHAEQSALARTLGRFGIRLTPAIHLAYDQISAELWARFEVGDIDSQRLRVERFERLIDRFSFDVAPADVSGHYIESLGSEHRLLPQARSVVERLATDFGLMLATNGIAEVQRRRFEASSIRPFFADVVISDEIGVAKPASGYFDEVFARMGHPKLSEALMVGDSLSSDIAGGSAYGIDTCWFNPDNLPNGSQPRPTYTIHRLTDVLDIVSEARTDSEC